jgi:hypothetical protein
MSFFVTLYVWTIVAATPHASGYTGKVFRDWRPMGEFQSTRACEQGAKTLSLQPDTFRCVRKDGS